jgi:L-ascorbate metabolism protein UlaG (beta-lactamase superfamily)
MTKLSWLGHSTVKLETNDGFIVFVDPWIVNNPMNSLTELPEKADLILITHDHFDHVGEAVELSRKTGAKVVAQPETIARLVKEGLLEENATKMNIGGTIAVGNVQAIMVQAFHTSLTGVPAGFIITIDDKVIYHLGDTALFGDLKLFGELYSIDYALIPIGGLFTMDYHHGAIAAKMIDTKKVIPIHYKTFPPLLQEVNLFVDDMNTVAPNIEVLVLEANIGIELYSEGVDEGK